MKNYRLIRLIVLLAAAVLSGCSVVFTSSLTGTIVDKQLYDNGSAGNEIADAEVYLYTDSTAWSADYTAWSTDNSVLPDNQTGVQPKYFIKTVTDEQGVYTFNGLIWNELFPEYGKSGDRREIYLLFYDEKYGLQKNPYPVYIVSDVTNRLPIFKLSKILNTASLAGVVRDAKTGEVLPNANVRIWIPESWTYASDGSIDKSESKLSWNTEPSYTAVTGADGSWEQEISYRMMPSSTDNRKTVIVRLTFIAAGYIAENESDSRVTNGGWDRDANGTVDPDEDEGYFQSGEISDATYADLGEISLADEYNTADLTGRIVNSATGAGEANVNVGIYVAEDWSYTAAGPDDIEPAGSVDWPENPTYTTATDADGDYSQSIRFERKPSSSDNRGTTRVRLVFTRDTFRIDSSTDAKLTDNGWDRDGNGTVDADETDSYYDPASVVKKDITNDLGSITVKQTRFSETLTGEVVKDVAGTLVGQDGVEVWLFFTPDHDGDPATPHQDTAKPTASVSKPTRKTSTSMQIITNDQIANGRFSFSGLEWEDGSYTGSQSDIGYYVYLPGDDEIASGTYEGTGTPLDANLTMKQLVAGGENNIRLQQ